MGITMDIKVYDKTLNRGPWWCRGQEDGSGT